jgi:hypothetical protein
MAIVFAAGLLHLGLDIWDTRRIQYRDFVADAGVYAKPIGFLMIGLGVLVIVELIKDIGLKIRFFLPFLMFSF